MVLGNIGTIATSLLRTHMCEIYLARARSKLDQGGIFSNVQRQNRDSKCGSRLTKRVEEDFLSDLGTESRSGGSSNTHHSVGRVWGEKIIDYTLLK